MRRWWIVRDHASQDAMVVSCETGDLWPEGHVTNSDLTGRLSPWATLGEEFATEEEAEVELAATWAAWAE